MESASVVQAAGDAYLAAMLRHQPLAHGQTETGSIAIRTEASFEKLIDQLRRYPAAGVRHLHQRTAADASHGYGDRAASRRVANGIADEVKNDLAQAVFVAADAQIVVLRHVGEGDARLIRDRLHELHAAPNAVSQIERSKVRNVSAVNAQNIVDGARKGTDSGTEVRNPLRVFAVVISDETGKQFHAG